MNVLTDQSRDDVWPVDVEDFCKQLRAPASLAFLKGIGKPQHLKLGDGLLKATLDSYLTRLIVAGDYRTVTSTLVSLFGDAVTGVIGADNGHRRPLAKAAAR